jgi:ribonuclease D
MANAMRGQEKTNKMSANNPLTYQYIDTAAQLEKLAQLLEKEKEIAIDLEADSMFHFNERVCLIQMTTRHGNYIVDPLMVKELSVLGPIFSNPDIQKVFHGADYDVRSLFRDFNICVANLFDTQIACRFLGMNETGLEAVVFNQFDIRLDKKFQKKDWSQRPLPEDMLAYAASDTIYLIPLLKAFEKELKKMGRLAWVHEECELMSQVRPAIPSQAPLFLKFKGAGRLNPRELAILEAILQYRKEMARKRDRPPFKVFGSLSILKIVKSKPLDLALLKKTKALSAKQMSMYGPGLVSAVQTALKISENNLISYPRKRSPMLKHAVRQRIKALKEWRDQKAEKLKLDPSLVCSKSVITDIATQNPDSPPKLAIIENLKNWQEQTLGKEIITTLRKTNGNRN